MTNPNGPLYRRVQSGSEYWSFVRRQEETFNHVFNLALSILPGEVIAELFGELAGQPGKYRYELMGPERVGQYPWIAGRNVTSPDAFLVSAESVLAIEIKFNAKTSLDQLAKYVALIAGEEIFGAEHQHLHLLFIFPADGEAKFHKQTSIALDELCEDHFQLLLTATSNVQVRNLFKSNSAAVSAVLSRLKVSCATWAQVARALNQRIACLGRSAGDNTLRRLLEGLEAEIRAHPQSGLEAHD